MTTSTDAATSAPGGPSEGSTPSSSPPNSGPTALDGRLTLNLASDAAARMRLSRTAPGASVNMARALGWCGGVASLHEGGIQLDLYRRRPRADQAGRRPDYQLMLTVEAAKAMVESLTISIDQAGTQAFHKSERGRRVEHEIAALFREAQRRR